MYTKRFRYKSLYDPDVNTPLLFSFVGQALFLIRHVKFAVKLRQKVKSRTTVFAVCTA